MVLGKSHSADKCKRGHLGVFEHPFFGKMGKNEGGPSGDIKKICEKKSHKAENKPAQKNLVMAGLEPMSFCLSDLEKAVVAKWQ